MPKRKGRKGKRGTGKASAKWGQSGHGDASLSAKPQYVARHAQAGISYCAAVTGERNAAPPQPEGGASAAQHQIGEGMTRGAGASAEKKSKPLDAPALDGEDGWVVYSPRRGRSWDSSSDDEEALPDDQKAPKERWVRVSVGALFSGAKPASSEANSGSEGTRLTSPR